MCLVIIESYYYCGCGFRFIFVLLRYIANKQTFFFFFFNERGHQQAPQLYFHCIISHCIVLHGQDGFKLFKLQRPKHPSRKVESITLDVELSLLLSRAREHIGLNYALFTFLWAASGFLGI